MGSQVITPEIVAVQPTEQTGKTSAKHVARDQNGKLLPGHTANPNGRPRTALISQALRERLEAGGAEKYAAAVESIALKGKRQADRLAAVNMIADRTEGKPVQAMLVGHTVDENSVRVIAEMLAKLTVPAALPNSGE